MLIGAMCLSILIVGFPSAAQEGDGHDHAMDLSSPYAGQENREIRTLSEEDIRQLQNGEGWGLAIAAELNGLPGPAHLLEMADAGMIQFSVEQIDRIRSLHREMKAQATALGLSLIDQERELNRRFAAKDISQNELRRLLHEIAETTAELRYVHLATHLQTLPILNPHQIHTYNSIRGYSAGTSESGGETAHSPQMHRH
jgi:hypothetical protein